MGKNRRVKDTSTVGGGGGRLREVGGIIALGAAVFLLLALVSFQAHGQLMGPFGRGIAGLVYGLCGTCSYLVVGVLAWTAIRSLIGRDPVLGWHVATGAALAVLCAGVLIHLIAPHYRVAGHGPGGAIGEHVAEILRAL